MFADTKSGSAVAVSFKKVKGKKGAGHPAVFFDFINVAFEE